MSLILDALRRGRGRTTPPGTTNAAQTDAVLQTLGYGRFSTGSRLNRVKRIIGYASVAIMFAVVIWGLVIWITQAYLTAPPSMEVTKTASGTSQRPPSSPRPLPPPTRVQPTSPAASQPGSAVAKPSSPVLPPSAIALPPTPAPVPAASSTSSPPSTPGAVPATPPRAILPPAPAPAPPAARSGQPAPPSAVVPKPTAPPAAAAAGPVTPPAPSNRKTPPAPARASTTPPTIQETPNRPEQGRAATAPQNLLVQQSHRADVPSELPPPPMGAPSSRTVLSMSAGANAGTRSRITSVWRSTIRKSETSRTR